MLKNSQQQVFLAYIWTWGGKGKKGAPGPISGCALLNWDVALNDGNVYRGWPFGSLFDIEGNLIAFTE